MANRRMFARTITDSDAFTDMPLSTQALYFHLGMCADDDGFVNNPKRVQRCIGAADDDMAVLVAKRFIIPFDSGVVVIKHWKINNYIRPDRYKATSYTAEILQLEENENGAYSLPSSEPMATLGIPTVIPTVDPGKDRLGKDRLGKSEASKQPRQRFKKPTVDEVAAYVTAQGYTIDPQYFIDYYDSNGWKVGRNPMKDWKATVRNWASRDSQSSEAVRRNDYKQYDC